MVSFFNLFYGTNNKLSSNIKIYNFVFDFNFYRKLKNGHICLESPQN